MIGEWWELGLKFAGEILIEPYMRVKCLNFMLWGKLLEDFR